MIFVPFTPSELRPFRPARCRTPLSLISGTASQELAEQILVRVLRENPGLTADSKIENEIEIVFQIQKDLRARSDETGGNRWLHYRWLEILNELFGDLGDQHPIPDDFNYVRVGAGDRNPLAFPLLVFMAGAGKIHVNEPSKMGEAESWRCLWGLQELVLRLISGNVNSRYFTRPAGAMTE